MTSSPGADARLRFSKMHGAGNDFVVLDLRDCTPPPDPQFASRLADRHFGVGCDQILTIEPPRSEQAVASYRIWNADGSDAGQCGNGARCVAAWLVRDGAAAAHFLIDSPVGVHAVEQLADGDFAVAMGVPRFEPAQIPLAGFAHAREEYFLPLQGESVRFGAVSMGNPHAVIEVGLVDAAPVERVGPLMQQNPSFPQSANVGFAQVVDHGHIRLRVYERGVGETLACGSGACAAAVVLMQRGRIGRDVRIGLPGGELRVRWPADDAEVTLSGPATFVFEGEWNP
ncbi:diaminopimelate epimerase [Stenotrophomonas sp. MMGLT7]|uniref:diaminopimelate epimerase n=1 Tax=Stenotrophomonas sp. MMGLT7 TaxID=2901227 RepID=UPI001E633233|nr:diaminopimelate epimerase [Stenotrophomonas sp. MMGLT7]MCD7098335.1 diaminopimelate epimerase [Stenotrophomonas sp. MMGLT7]